MRKKNLITLLLIASFVLVFGSWAAAGPDWKEEQAKWFSQIPVKPGDKIDTSNAEKVKDLFPPSMVKWVEKGDMTVDVGEVKYDLAADAEWKAASAKNEGKYDVDKTMEVIEKASGKHPTFVYGVPFPTIDCKNDPNAPVKIMHNAAANRYRCGTFYQEFADEWISRKGYERSLYGIYYGYFFWSRPDGPKPDPEGAEELVLCKVTEPEDLNGMNTLTKRFLDNRADDYYCYIPTIRRVKRMSGASRSDPFAGSEATIDDTNGWAGKNGSMKWKFLEQKVMLFPMATRTLQEPYQTTKQANGSWKVNDPGDALRFGYMVPGYKGAPWMFCDVTWVPRMVYVLEATPVDPYYNYGKMIKYVDPEAGVYAQVKFDKALEYWKTAWIVQMPVDWGDTVRHRTVGATTEVYNMIDDRAQHATQGPCFGKWRGHNIPVFYMDPRVEIGMMVPSMLTTVTK